MKAIIVCVVIMMMLFAAGCTTNVTHRVQYPPSSELFVTSGDDPGSESRKPYVPKGQFIHVAREFYFPIPLLGMFMKLGEADPQQVFDNEVIERVREMGGDALITADVQYVPQGSVLMGLFGLRSGGCTVISGQVVKR